MYTLDDTLGALLYLYLYDMAVAFELPDTKSFQTARLSKCADRAQVHLADTRQGIG